LNREVMMPLLVECEELPGIHGPIGNGDGDYEYVPLIVLRRQRRVGEEVRVHQDPSLVDVAMTFCRTWAQTNHTTGGGG